MIRPARLLLLFPLLLVACVYRQDIPQGNFYKPEDIAKLREGMTREQVAFVMGTPMIRDPFHPNRWDYVLYVDSLEEARHRQQRVTIHFDGETVARIEKVGIAEDVTVGNEGIVPED